ncbi:hypothetical protein SAMN04487906_2873 [Zhouia amylolytica]|uniref:Uncharacterized protein n=2 Tax=Zhouia amylolytica TaxID=376730 RepID=W2USN4_9FLAO|nr:hypothetical protein [Zhouia amylolytica]ETN96486.1 hypothetical protein P278_05640 [Zhouia amylolytica AD3]MCQ0110025.1 hypothetical protein [Zhouia amylolytica]SFT08815.1 hypothetical protein SAMN04487906_2873 [Zhouia amylolytica]
MNILNTEDSFEIDRIRKDYTEVSNWIEHLEFIAKELMTLKDIAQQYLVEHALEYSFDAYLEENRSDISALYNYRFTLEGQKECQDVDCDVFYKEHHESIREKYHETVDKYKRLKNKVIGNL